MALEAGRHLLHYRLVEKIGEGGMGVVWRAEDTRLHRPVALKVLPETLATDPERRARFGREARAVAGLNHPNIVTLHSIEEAETDTGTVRFITMELVEGRTLTELLPRGGFSLERLLETAIPIADAVSRAHRAGITHRDLKPDNIMIDGEGRLRVLDFGLAKLQEQPAAEGDGEAETVTSNTAEGRVLGTVAYMSPEQAEGREVDPRSDVFSLGTMLYEMACGERPFRGDTPLSTLGSIMKDEPGSLAGPKPGLPRDLARILRRCLAKDPERRYQSALGLRNELEDLRAEITSPSPLAGSGPGPGNAAPSWLRPSLLVGVPLLVVIAVALVVAALRVGTRGETREPSHTSRPLTATIEWNLSPCWSPDGKYLAFARMTAGSLDIYLQSAAGGDAVARVEGPGDQVAPRWSPDGGHLAYLSSQEPGSWVLLVPADGGSPKKLVPTDIGALDVASMRRALGDRPWSADGRTLLVSRSDDKGRISVHRVDRSTGESEQITFPPAGCDDLGATFSFDGERILFERPVLGRGTLMVMPAAGGEPVVLLDDAYANHYATWRPDNRSVVFRSDRGGSSTNLFEIDTITREIRQLTSETNEINNASVSLDDRLVYASFRHDTFLFVLDVETGENRRITSHTRENFGARFAPDGRTIAYHSTRTGDSEIWMHHLDGRPEVRFTDHEGWDVYPEWSPDGKRVVFVSDRDGGEFKLHIANADGGGGARLLVDQPISWRRGGYSPVNTFLVSRWSPDGALIAYQVDGRDGAELWTVRPDGEDARKRFEGVTEFDWYTDSRRGIITRPSGSETELRAVDLETGREESLFVGALQEIDVRPDGGAVTFAFGRGHLSAGLALLRLEPPADSDGLPRALGKPEYVARSEGTWHVHSGGWAPDSKRFVYTQDTDYGDLFELVER